jgi:hypothetical protein
MSTGDRNTISLLEQQAKITTLDALPQVQLLAYLRGLPTLTFSDEDSARICQQFSVSADELNAIVTVLAARSGQPTPELLRVIGAAVRHGHKANGGAAKC